MASSEQPNLWVTQGDELLLCGIRCNQCGSTQFPPQPYGCEACGADGSCLEEVRISSKGTLRAYTTVHLDQKLQTPFQVAEVQTEASQLVRGRLEFPQAELGSLVQGAVREIEGTQRFVFVPAVEGKN